MRTSKIAADRQFNYWTSVADAVISWAGVVCDGSSDALAHLRAALANHQRTQGNILRPYLLGVLAEAEHVAGFGDLALGSLQLAGQVATTAGARFYQPVLSVHRGRMLAARGDTSGAIAALDAAHSEALSQGAVALAATARAALLSVGRTDQSI